MMDAQERILTTMNHEEPDKVPAFESAFTNNSIMTYYGLPPDESQMGLALLNQIPVENRSKILMKMVKKRSILKASYKNLYELYRRAKIDLVTSNTTYFPKDIIDFKDDKVGLGFIDEYGRIMRFEQYKDGTFILGYQGGHFKSFEEYESWEPLDPHWEARMNGFLGGRDVQMDMNNEIFSIPATASLMEVTWQIFGIELFSKILARPKQAKRIFDDHGKFALELVKILAENDAQIVLLWDDYGFKNGLFMSPRNYRTYVFPWIKRICEAAHKRDCKIILHSDGDLTEIFEDIIKSGVDGLNPIEPTTANPDYDIFKLYEKYGDKLTFIGNVSPMMLAAGEISEIENYTKKLIKELAPGGGYILSSGHSINPAVTVDRFLAMHNIKEKYGKYPINIAN
ncbi:MAG: uroporphyrinogen decarboxylase family protein [Candidatus Hermodarchaeota archaeon]